VFPERGIIRTWIGEGCVGISEEGGCRLYTFRQKWSDLKGDFEESREVGCAVCI